jgi:hypothetical protein
MLFFSFLIHFIEARRKMFDTKKKKKTMFLDMNFAFEKSCIIGSYRFHISIHPDLERFQVCSLNILKRKISKGEMFDLWETKKVSNFHLN